MGVYKDREVTEKLLPSVLKDYAINELQEPNIISSREIINQLYVVIKSLRNIKWSIERDNIEANDEYSPILGDVVDHIESAINIYEPIADEVEKTI